MQQLLQNLPLADQGQAEAVVKAAKAWLAAPLGQSARSKRAFVRNRADEVLGQLDADGQAAVLAVMVANYDGWYDRCRQFPPAVQAMVLDRLLRLRKRAERSLPDARRLAHPLTARAKAIRKQADALEARIRRELREKAAKLRKAAAGNRKRGQERIAAEQERQALALLRQAEGALGGCEHPLAAEVQHLRKKEAQVRAEAAAARALPKTLVEQVDLAIASAIAPDALMHLEMPKRLLALRLAAPLSDEWWETADQCLRFPSAGAALADAWEQLQRATRGKEDGDEPTLSREEAEALAETIERRLLLRRAAEDPSLYDPAPEAIARALFPRTNPSWISVEAAMVRLAEELRRTLEAPCVDEALLEKIEQLAARVEAGDVSRIAELRSLQLRAAQAELRERARAVRAFDARKRAKKHLRVAVRELLR
jgi:hypothetical protein